MEVCLIELSEVRNKMITRIKEEQNLKKSIDLTIQKIQSVAKKTRNPFVHKDFERYMNVFNRQIKTAQEYNLPVDDYYKQIQN